MKSEEFKEKYDIKLKSFKIDNFIKFIKDFRHLIQHKNLPPIQATLKIQPVDPNINIDTSNQSLVFNKKELLEWGDWKKNSRDFIEEYEYEEINLKDILQDYQKFIKEFYKWIRSTIKDKFSKELNEYNIIKNKIIELDKKIKSKIT